MGTVNFSVDGQIATIEIDRPGARNAIDNAVATGIAAALDTVNHEQEIRVAILTGAGGTFCAGMDLKAFVRGEAVRIPGYGFAGITQARIDKPLIAAVEGHALAGGFEIALACDLIVSAEDARFGLPEVKRGLVANGGGLVRLPRELPFRIAMELALSGESVSARYLHDHGLINRLAPRGNALAAARELAEMLCRNAPLSLAVSKRVIREAQDWSCKEMFDRQQDLTGPVFKSHDAREGASAFVEKRLPQWRGS
ncbi:crotonase/enoyl-CoA hydratase family protein [Comamonadaceae bacterium G21597-S1]|nr:crotonase/enoyl-CoA hydratase family protein [Comamonadaceae bacterium G21597-S1]